MCITRSHLVSAIIIGISSITLAACTPSTLFSQLARTKEEAGAAESVKNAQLQAQQLQSLQAKQPDFTYSGQLLPIAQNASGTIFAYMNIVDDARHYQVDGFVPAPNSGAYFVYVTNDDQSRFDLLGELTLTDDSHYQLEKELSGDTTDFISVIVSDDASASARPNNPVLAGKMIVYQP